MQVGRSGHGVSRRNRRTVLAAAAISFAALAGACSSGESADGPPSSNIAATETTGPGGRSTCNRSVAPAPKAAAVTGSASDHDITSFDGTTIRAHWFPRPGGATGPTILMGPGWGSPGQTNLDAAGLFGSLNIRGMHEAGFNVLTWDPRGFGLSTGEAKIDHKDFEGRDVQVLLDWVAQQPGVQTDAAGDPRVGMVGGSYGGGIQLVTAAIDCRVDTIVPDMAWHSLETSLFKAETPKQGWANLLTSVTRTRPVDPTAARANDAANRTGVVDPKDIDWFRDRGPGHLVKNIAVPTLLVHGTVDTLFTLDEAVTNYRMLRERGVPVSFLWYCGGHGTCLTSTLDGDHIKQRVTAWLRRYLLDDESVDLGPKVDILDQTGARYTGEDYPLPAGPAITATGSGTLNLTAEGGAGPLTPPPGSQAADPLRSLVVGITPAKAANAVNVPVTVSSPAVIVGPPTVELTYSGTVPAGERPTRVFAQLVDEATGLTVGNQITPIKVTLDGATHTTSVPLEVVSYAATPGSRLVLQLVATTTAYAQPRLGGTVTFEKVAVTLPTAAGLTPKG